MERVTERQIEAVCGWINAAHGFGGGARLWRREDSRHVATIGMFYIDYACGGVNLARIVNEGGGITYPFAGKFMPKRELYGLMRAYLAGLGLAGLGECKGSEAGSASPVVAATLAAIGISAMVGAVLGSFNALCSALGGC